MDISEILSIERSRSSVEDLMTIHIFKENNDRERTFYRLYEWSCYITNLCIYDKEIFGKDMKVFRPNAEDDFCMWGLPQNSLSKLVKENLQVVADSEEHFIITLPASYGDTLEADFGTNMDRFLKWKDTTPVSKTASTKRKDTGGIGYRKENGTETSKKAILQQFLGLDTLHMSPHKIVEEVSRIQMEYHRLVVGI